MRPPRLEDVVDRTEDGETTLHVPTAPARPGEVPATPEIDAVAGELDRPNPSCTASETHDLAHGLIRVLDENGDGICEPCETGLICPADSGFVCIPTNLGDLCQCWVTGLGCPCTGAMGTEQCLETEFCFTGVGCFNQ